MKGKGKLNAIMVTTHFVKQNQELPHDILFAKVCFDSCLNMSNTDVLSLARENWVFTRDALSAMKLGRLPN